MSVRHESSRHVRRIRWWLAVFIAGMLLSGVTAFPLETEVRWLAGVLGADGARPGWVPAGMLEWLIQVRDALAAINAQWPFLAYGTDWLAFAHLVIAAAFIGPWRDPVRHEFIINWGLFCCVAVVPLAMIAGSIRGVPVWWRLIDCSFGVFGAIPLLMAKREIRRRAPAAQRRTAT